IERPYVLQRLLYGFDWAAERLSYFLVLLVLQSTQMLVYDRNRIRENLGSGFPIAILTHFELLLVITQLTEQALTQATASHSRWRRRRNSHQLVVTGNEVSILAEIANYQLSSLPDCTPRRYSAQLPCEMVREVPGLGQKVLE